MRQLSTTRRSFMAGSAAVVSVWLAGAARAEEVSVREFGARGDGLRDDSAAVQAALDSGLPVYLPAGNYLISRTLMVSSGTRLRGSGAATVLKKRNEMDARVIQNADPSGNRDIYLADFRIDGSRREDTYRSGRDGVLLSRCEDCTIERLQVDNCLNDGLIIEYGTRNRISETKCNGNAKDGLYLSGTEHCTLSRNDCRGNAVAAIAVAASWWVEVSDNVARDNGVADFMLGRDARYVEVTSNVFGPGSAHSIVTSAEPIPTAQKLHGNSYPGGSTLFGARDCTISANELHGKVSLILFDDGTVANNVIDGSSSQGLLLQGSNGNRVSDNQISGWNPRYAGIQIAVLDISPEQSKSRSNRVTSESNELRGNVVSNSGPDSSSVAIAGRNVLDGASVGP